MNLRVDPLVHNTIQLGLKFGAQQGNESWSQLEPVSITKISPNLACEMGPSRPKNFSVWGRPTCNVMQFHCSPKNFLAKDITRKNIGCLRIPYKKIGSVQGPSIKYVTLEGGGGPRRCDRGR